MKDTIGQSENKEKISGNENSSRVQAKMPHKGNKTPLIIGAVVAIAAIAAGIWFVSSHSGKTPGAGQTAIEYPVQPQKPNIQEKEMSDSIRSAKAEGIPTLIELEDMIEIEKIYAEGGTADGKNPHITAKLPEESLAQKAAAFKSSTNNDTVGWIRIPNTNVDYPVVFKAGVDNASYYVSKGYDKQYSKDGVIWADYENTFPNLSENTVLYGHNWHNVFTPRTMANMHTNDTMFSLVMSYHHPSFAQENPFIYFSTTEKDYVFQVFASFYTDLAFTYNYANMPKDVFQKTIAEAKAKSLVNYNVPVTTDDRILTLSTCTRYHGNTSNQRFVVMAKMVPEGTPSTVIGTHTKAIAYNASLS